MLEEAQETVKKISDAAHKKEVFTSSFFITLLVEQVGQVAEKYIREGRLGKDIEVDITDIIVVSLAYLNWLEKDSSEAFKKSLEKHERAIARFIQHTKQ
jgi:NTP pyrophosphatase (non-canonical NTP hydrolase)